MNIFRKVIKVVGPFAKKFGPILIAGISGMIGAAAKQKAQANIDNMKHRIEDLEALVKNK